MKYEKLNKSVFNNLMGKDKTPNVNQNHVILGFFEFEFSPEIFTKDLELKPLETGLKGEKYLAGSKKHVERVHEYNMWTYEWKTYSNEYIADFISKFIDEVIIPRIETIKRLTNNCNVQLRIVQYYYDGCNPGMYFKREHNKILADINSSIDIDLYCLGN